MRAYVSFFLLAACAACSRPTFTSLSGPFTKGMENEKNGLTTAPTIGACAGADNDTCRAAAAEWGEYFIRLTVAHDFIARNRYAKLSLQQAANGVAMKKLLRLVGNGRTNTLGRHGNISMTFNT